jgi:hypothetical protein
MTRLSFLLRGFALEGVDIHLLSMIVFSVWMLLATFYNAFFFLYSLYVHLTHLRRLHVFQLWFPAVTEQGNSHV